MHRKKGLQLKAIDCDISLAITNLLLKLLVKNKIKIN